MNMGFSLEMSENALEATAYSLDEAISLLLEQTEITKKKEVAPETNSKSSKVAMNAVLVYISNVLSCSGERSISGSRRSE